MSVDRPTFDFLTDVVPFAQACLALGVSPRTARRRLEDPESGFPRPFTIGGRQQYVYRPDVDAYLRGQVERAKKAPLSQNAA
jgi:hypothetical protein